MLSRIICLKISLDRSSWNCKQTIDPQKIVRTIPSVQYVSLPYFGDCDRLGEHRWWKAVGRGIDRTVQLVPNRIGDRVLQYIRSPQYDPATNLDGSSSLWTRLHCWLIFSCRPRVMTYNVIHFCIHFPRNFLPLRPLDYASTDKPRRHRLHLRILTS